MTDLPQSQPPSADAAARERPDPADVQASARELRRAVTAMGRRLRASTSSGGLSQVKLGILEQLLREGSRTPGDLAMTSAVQPQSLTRVLTALEEDGLVTREQSQVDKRQWLVTLTDSGRQMLRAESARREAWLSEVMADRLTDGEVIMLRAAAEVMRRIADRPQAAHTDLRPPGTRGMTA